MRPIRLASASRSMRRILFSFEFVQETGTISPNLMKRALLCICPPYPMVSPPAGAAALLGYLKAHGIADFGFADLRLGTPGCYEATYSATGVFGESFVMDIPDLPLVLQL